MELVKVAHDQLLRQQTPIPEWVCDHCTFSNRPRSAICEMCQTMNREHFEAVRRRHGVTDADMTVASSVLRGAKDEFLYPAAVGLTERKLREAVVDDSFYHAFEVLFYSSQSERKGALAMSWAACRVGNLCQSSYSHPRVPYAAKIDAAIKMLSLALHVYKPDEVETRERWAQCQANLANAYLQRIKGDIALNFEAALGCYERALSVLNAHENAQVWTLAKKNLATVYRRRMRGDAAANHAKADACDAEIDTAAKSFAQVRHALQAATSRVTPLGSMPPAQLDAFLARTAGGISSGSSGGSGGMTDEELARSLEPELD